MRTDIKLGLDANDSAPEKRTKLREHKGHSLLEFPDSYVVIDLETTGFDPSYDDILEMAALRVVNGVAEDTFSSLVNPGCPIDEYITDLTGITDDMVKDAPPLQDVLPRFLAFVGNDIIIGHNVGFDIRFIYDICELAKIQPFSNDYVDTMRLSRTLFKEEKHHRLSDLAKRFSVGVSVEHRALEDVEQTYKCYCYMKDYVADHGIILKARPGSQWKAKDITASTSDYDEQSPLFGKAFVFTGTLDKMPRREAMQLVVDHGGVCHDTVKRDTNFLVLGANDYSKLNGTKSNKQKKAEQLRLAGNDIEIISENVFYEMLDF